MVGNYGVGYVVSPSMEPEIPKGSLIVAERVELSELSVGDDILFFSDDPEVPKGIPVCHRIAEIVQEKNGALSFTTKGVANRAVDPYPARGEAVIGRVIWHSVWLGTLVEWSQNSYVYPILLLILAVNVIVNLVFVIRDAKRLKKESESEHSKQKSE